MYSCNSTCNLLKYIYIFTYIHIYSRFFGNKIMVIRQMPSIYLSEIKYIVYYVSIKTYYTCLLSTSDLTLGIPLMKF